MGETWNIDSHRIHISNMEKVFYPDSGSTKGDVISYYKKISKTLLPYVKDRPIVMHRFPDGIKEDGFYQKERSDYFPGWIGRTRVKLAQGGSQTLVIANNRASLIYLANQGVLVFHGWLSRKDRISYPDRLIFDLDPPSKSKEGFTQVKFAAYKLRDIFRDTGMHPFVMSTGSHGLHIVVPIRRHHDFDAVREYARETAVQLAEKYPGEITVETRKNKRRGRLFLDYMRNAYGQTSVVPYSLRALPGSPVAVPLDWEELPSFSDPKKYTSHNIFQRLGKKKDPWKDFFSKAKRMKTSAI